MDHLKKICLSAAAAAAALFATIALAADPIADFLVNAHRAEAKVPQPPAQKTAASAASSDDDFELEAAYDGRKIAAEDVAKRFQAVKGLMERVCAQPSNQPYFAKTPCIAASLTDAQAADTSKATEEEIAAAKRVFAQIAAINEKTRAIMVASGQNAHEDAVRQSEARLDPQVKENQDALLSGRATWGEYNSRRSILTRRAKRGG